MKRLFRSVLQNEYFVTMPSAHSDWAFLHRVPAGRFFADDCREAVEPQTVLAMISMGMGITLRLTVTRRCNGLVWYFVR
jgi:hypothetical protein